MKKFLKYIYSYFLTIYIFESFKTFKKIKWNKIDFFFIKSLYETKNNKIIRDYFTKNKSKLSRFNKKSKFIGLYDRKKIVSSGWVYLGKAWKVEEVDKNIKLNKRYLLYDFFTEHEFRNKGYYKLLLRIIQNKFKNKKFLIYSLSHNYASIKAIEKSGFKFLKKIKK